MKFLKYRTKWAWGYGQWEIIRLYEENPKEYGYKNMKEYLEYEVIRHIHDEHNYSDKYRGIDYNVITAKRLNKKDRAMLIERYKKHVRYLKDDIPFYENVLKELQDG